MVILQEALKRYSRYVTDEIRAIIRERIAESGDSQAGIARRMGVLPQNLNRALQEQGNVPVLWQRILRYFSLKIIVVPLEFEPPRLEKRILKQQNHE